MSSDRKIILSLAIPAVLQTVVRSLFVIIDAFWAGKLGSNELAGLTIATFVVWGILSFGELIATGTNSLVAQATGAGDIKLAKKISLENIFNTLLYSVAFGFILIPLLPGLWSIVSLNELHSKLASEYLIPFLVGLPCITLLLTVSAIFRGYGDTRTPFYLLLIAVILNFFLAPLFIFGFNGFLKFGLTGAAISTLVSYFFAFLVGIIFLYKRNLIGKLSSFRFDFPVLKETFKIGFPISLNGVAFSFIYILISRVAAEYGTLGFAAMGIAHRSEAMSYQISVGFALAASILVGQNVGAGDYFKAEKYAYKIMRYTSYVLLAYSFLLFMFSYQVASVFTSDLDVRSVASVFNKITATVIFFSGIEVVTSGAFSGAGDSLPPAVIGTPLNFLRIPLAALFSYFWGLNGIWFAIALTVFLKGVIIFLWFKKGNWKNKRSKLLPTSSKVHEPPFAIESKPFTD